MEDDEVSLTVLLESVLIKYVIDAKENRDILIKCLPGV